MLWKDGRDDAKRCNDASILDKGVMRSKWGLRLPWLVRDEWVGRWSGLLACCGRTSEWIGPFKKNLFFLYETTGVTDPWNGLYPFHENAIYGTIPGIIILCFHLLATPLPFLTCLYRKLWPSQISNLRKKRRKNKIIINDKNGDKNVQNGALR